MLIRFNKAIPSISLKDIIPLRNSINQVDLLLSNPNIQKTKNILLYRSKDGKVYEQIAELSNNTTTFSDQIPFGSYVYYAAETIDRYNQFSELSKPLAVTLQKTQANTMSLNYFNISAFLLVRTIIIEINKTFNNLPMSFRVFKDDEEIERISLTTVQRIKIETDFPVNKREVLIHVVGTDQYGNEEIRSVKVKQKIFAVNRIDRSGTISVAAKSLTNENRPTIAITTKRLIEDVEYITLEKRNVSRHDLTFSKDNLETISAQFNIRLDEVMIEDFYIQPNFYYQYRITAFNKAGSILESIITNPVIVRRQFEAVDRCEDSLRGQRARKESQEQITVAPRQVEEENFPQISQIGVTTSFEFSKTLVNISIDVRAQQNISYIRLERNGELVATKLADGPKIQISDAFDRHNLSSLYNKDSSTELFSRNIKDSYKKTQLTKYTYTAKLFDKNDNEVDSRNITIDTSEPDKIISLKSREIEQENLMRKIIKTETRRH